MKLHWFQQASNVHDFAFDAGMPFNRIIPVSNLRDSEIKRLCDRGLWGVRMNIEVIDSKTGSKSMIHRDYFELDSFRVEYQQYLFSRTAVVKNFNVFKLQSLEDFNKHCRYVANDVAAG